MTAEIMGISQILGMCLGCPPPRSMPVNLPKITIYFYMYLTVLLNPYPSN